MDRRGELMFRSWLRGINPGGRKIALEKVFDNEEAAEHWCEAEGLTVGFMSTDPARGLKPGASWIAKWYNLDDEDLAQLDGVLLCPEERDGPAKVVLYEPEPSDENRGAA